MKQYRWPSMAPVTRQFLVKDNFGRYGIAYSDNVYHRGVLFAHPIDIAPKIYAGEAIFITDTVWRAQDDGTYIGAWYDYDGPTSPSAVPDNLLHRIVIIDDLGYTMPDKWADELLTGLASNQPLIDTMSVKEAEEFAMEAGELASARGIRSAAANGHIPGATKVGRDWRIPYDGFNWYLDNRPKPGRKNETNRRLAA